MNSAHPGFVKTELAKHIEDALRPTFGETGTKFVKDTVSNIAWEPRDAALTQVYIAVGPEIRANKVTGKYFHPLARGISRNLTTNANCTQKTLTQTHTRSTRRSKRTSGLLPQSSSPTTND